jgi:protein-disulfide isomerase
LNGKLYVGSKSYEQLKSLVETEQRRAKALAEIGADLLSQGPAKAPVTVELFADLTSPVTLPAMAVIDALMEQRPSAIRLQFRNFPLAFHPHAGLAHEAAMNAALHGRFWEMAAYALQHQESLREQDLLTYAARLGLDEAGFADALQQRRYTPRVEADVTEGLGRGIRGSPVIFVNGRRIDGVPSLETLREYVDTELAAKK